MGLADFKYPLLVLILGFAYFQFFVGHQHPHQKFEVGTHHLTFHANWTKSLDDICCLSKYFDALEIEGLHTLDLSFSMSSFSDEDILKLFPKKLRAFKDIKIDISGLKLTNRGIDHILSVIPSEVQFLEFSLNGVKTQNGFGEELAQRLNSLSNLNSLKLSLIMAIKGNEVDYFFQDHKPSQHLRRLHLVLIGNDLTEDALKHSESYLSALRLEELMINLYANKAGPKGAEYIAAALNTQKQLKNLWVDFYFNNITETGTENVTNAIQQMTTLEGLDLNLDFNFIKNEGGKSVGKMFAHLTQLSSLSIGVASKNFGYLGFKEVVTGLGHLVDLRHLTLRCGINRVGYNGAEITVELLKKLTKLEKLELGFLENYIGDDGISLISEQVATMEGLKEVYLNFAFNDAKSYGLVKVIKALLKNKYESLHLSLSSNEFKDSEVKLIEKFIPTLIAKNEYFALDFMETAISKKQLAALEQIFSDSNSKHGKKAKLSANSIIAEDGNADLPPVKPTPQPKSNPNSSIDSSNRSEETKTPSSTSGQL